MASALLSLVAGDLVLEARWARRGDRLRERLVEANPRAEADLRSAREVLDQAVSKGRELEPLICPSANRDRPTEGILPLGGWPSRETLLGNENGSWVTFRADRYGFRNPDDIVYGRSPSRPRLVLLGDSYAQGFAVGGSAEPAAILRSHGYSTLSLGCASNAGLAALATFSEYGRSFAPDVVVWLYYEGNDLEGLREERGTAMVRYLDPGYSQHLRERRPEIEAALDAHASLHPRRGPRALLVRALTLSALRRRASRQLGRDFRGELRHFERVARRLRDEVRDRRAKLLFVYLPEGTALMSGRRPGSCARSPLGCKGAILGAMAELGVASVDFAPRIQELPEPASAFPHPAGLGHYSPDGYRLLGDTIAAEVARLLAPRGEDSWTGALRKSEPGR